MEAADIHLNRYMQAIAKNGMRAMLLIESIANRRPLEFLYTRNGADKAERVRRIFLTQNLRGVPNGLSLL